jgi:glycosyltransferase involved in cell wall biosynthesis
VRVRARLVDHQEGIRIGARPSRPEARARLGLPPNEVVFVVPGFIHPEKGAERAAEALGPTGRVYVVGSVKDRTPRNLAHLERLRELTARADRVELVERYLGEDELDAWVAAADAVVLPYRRSWSSGALARAQALGVPAIVTSVGGLAEQAGPDDVVVENDATLARAMAAVSRDRALRP